MKKLFLILFVATGIIMQACEGPEGPPGEPGINIVGEAYEVEVSFNAENNYIEFFDFTEPLVEGDAVLVYMYEASPVDSEAFAWRLLPQTFYFENGILVYNFDYTPVDFSIFLDNSPIDFAQLDSYWTDNLLFRVVVLPADLVSSSARMDFYDYEATMKYLDIEEGDFIRLTR
ncbi:hypothetical protein IFO69_13985 [Echinicola sp. CAU 1574]|uniref:Collagen-like protein n=1 Tax=Echinicola arenosa TaxID=2774144 RepID=A0ABR9AMW2_9BACT|nr:MULTISPECIES: hypothetical protein [Echinicola]MBD8489864.1 hypothetical protein [Echinicola arenosa]